jgi:hypothetical protein
MSAEDKLQARWTAFLEPEVEFVSPEAEEQYKARALRLKRAVLLEGTPDRVPVSILSHYYPALRRGMTQYEATYDYQKAADVWADATRDLEPDTQIGGVATAIPGRAFDLLDAKLFSWPGHGVPRDSGLQYNEREWMGPDEYDHLIDDPTDYLTHVYMPRSAGALEGFSSLVSPLEIVQIALSAPYLIRWSLPEVRASVEKIMAAGEECAEWARVYLGIVGQLMAEGFPAPTAGMSLAPFDFIGDTLRGTRGIVMDLYRRPDKVLQACDRIARLMVRWVTSRLGPTASPLIFIPLHKGADGFMSDDQFKEFYWPGLRKVILGLAEDGFVPYLFAEGAYNSRLEVIRDLPPGKALWHFDQIDMRAAKERLAGVCCVQGNVPLSLMHLGSRSDVAAYCRDLIEAVGPGGGFILDVGAAIDEAKDENVRAVIETAKAYGAY